MNPTVIAIFIAIALSGCDAITHTRIKVSASATDNRDFEQISNDVLSAVGDTTAQFRFSKLQAQEDLRIAPRFGGATLALQGLDGGLASQAKNPEAPLLAVVKDASYSRLACVRSDDQGNTWKDWAVSEEITNPYAIGTCREITADGAVIGTFTSAIEPSNDNVGKSKIYFFRIPIGL